jgi:hypothetical protein
LIYHHNFGRIVHHNDETDDNKDNGYNILGRPNAMFKLMMVAMADTNPIKNKPPLFMLIIFFNE